jgi:hypothetical protein
MGVKGVMSWVPCQMPNSCGLALSFDLLLDPEAQPAWVKVTMARRVNRDCVLGSLKTEAHAGC